MLADATGDYLSVSFFFFFLYYSSIVDVAEVIIFFVLCIPRYDICPQGNIYAAVIDSKRIIIIIPQTLCNLYDIIYFV